MTAPTSPTPAGGLTALVGALLAGSLTVPAPSMTDLLPTTPRTQAALLPGLSPEAPVPDPPALAARLAGPLSDPVLGNPAALVVDAETGKVLLDRASTVPAPPASTLKIVTAAAALATFAPDTRLRTTVRYSPAGGGTLWLVGAGDPTLTAAPPADAHPGSPASPAYPPAPARLPDLARQVRDAGITTVARVVGDGSVFVGPPVAPGWREGYVTDGNVAPVSGLEVDGGRPGPGAPGPRSPTPDAAAAVLFASALREHGVAVAATGTGQADRGARQVAAADSPPVPVLVEKMLLESDNDLAESLGRLVARERGLPASFVGATRAVLDVLSELGVPTEGSFLADVSGLSIGNRIPPTTLVGVLREAAMPGHEDLRGVLTGLPVAGFSGTLTDRFRLPEWSAGAGTVRAKTGSLRIVTSLAGQVVDADRRLLLFAFLAPVEEQGQTRIALDRVATALAGCGCQSSPPARSSPAPSAPSTSPPALSPSAASPPVRSPPVRSHPVVLSHLAQNPPVPPFPAAFPMSPSPPLTVSPLTVSPRSSSGSSILLHPT